MWDVILQGYLTKLPVTEEYGIISDGGVIADLALRASLIGHHAKVVCATMPEVGAGLGADKLRNQLESLESVLSHIRGMA